MLLTAPPPSTVVEFPERKTATKTLLPSALAASERGASPSIAIRVGGAERLAGSKERTASVPEQETHARCGLPAKTTSRGSSSTLSVRTTLPVESRTTLTLSETVFTTQASSFVRARTDAGSRPTGMLPMRTRFGPLASNTSRRSSAVFTARSFDPSGVRSSGWT